jgi:hypothetical protein
MRKFLRTLVNFHLQYKCICRGEMVKKQFGEQAKTVVERVNCPVPEIL